MKPWVPDNLVLFLYHSGIYIYIYIYIFIYVIDVLRMIKPMGFIFADSPSQVEEAATVFSTKKIGK